MFPAPRLMLEYGPGETLILELNPQATSIAARQCIEFLRQLPVKFVPYSEMKGESDAEAD